MMRRGQTAIEYLLLIGGVVAFFSVVLLTTQYAVLEPSGHQIASAGNMLGEGINSFCGNGLIEAGEECDGELGCGENCRYAFGTLPGGSTSPICGNWILESGEQCDDGNTRNGDGCSSACRLQRSACGNGDLDPGEGCDDGNSRNDDGCSSTCTAEAIPNPVCGDMMLTFPEQCDDGNTRNGDGCSSTCRTEVWVHEYGFLNERQWFYGASLGAGGKLYFIGGTEVVPSRPAKLECPDASFDISSGVYSYDAGTGLYRTDIATAEYGGKIYAAGGIGGTVDHCTPGNPPTSAGQEYFAVLDTQASPRAWRELPNIPNPLLGMKAVAYNGKVYVIGGYEIVDTAPPGSRWPNPRASSFGHVRVFDISANSWLANAAPMPTPRHNFALTVYNGKIYAIGGIHDETVSGKVESYDPATNSWSTAHASMPTPRFNLGASVLGNSIFAMGGFTSIEWLRSGYAPFGYTTDDFDWDQPGRSSANERFNPASNSWATEDPVPFDSTTTEARSHGGRIYVRIPSGFDFHIFSYAPRVP